MENHQHIDILVNNAGIVKAKMFDQLSIGDFEQVTKVNYLGPVQMMKCVLPSMQRRSVGHIVNIASSVAVTPGLKVSEYVGSKHALYGMHHCLRNELLFKKQNIYTTLVCPFAINTGMFKGFKTTMQFLFPLLDEQYVAQIVHDGILANRKLVFIPRYLDLVFSAMRMLPLAVSDWLC